VLSALAAALFAIKAKITQIPVLISYAVGTLLGAVFLELLPHAFGMADSLERMAGTVLFGILLFFVLEKLVLWRHCHEEQCEARALRRCSMIMAAGRDDTDQRPSTTRWWRIDRAAFP
jgi:zinc and cadmium transporter